MKKTIRDKKTRQYIEIDVPYKGPRMEVPGEYLDDGPLYIASNIYLGLMKKAIITHTEAKGRSFFIHYQAKKGKAKGVVELYDLGPA